MAATNKKYQATFVMGKSTLKALDTKTAAQAGDGSDRTFAELLPLLAQGGVDIVITDGAANDILATPSHQSTPLAKIIRSAQEKKVPGITIEQTNHSTDSRRAFEQVIGERLERGERVVAFSNEDEPLEAMGRQHPSVGLANSAALLIEALNHGLLGQVPGLINSYSSEAIISGKTLPAVEIKPVDTFGRNYNVSTPQDVEGGREGPLGKALGAVAQTLAPKEAGFAARVAGGRHGGPDGGMRI